MTKTTIIEKQPIIFVLGPSGVGKSSMGKFVASDLNFIHIEQDLPGVDGIDSENLRTEWDEFMTKKNATNLAKSIRIRIQSENKSGAIITFNSTVTLPVDYIKEAENVGVHTILLYGSRKDCFGSFLQREKILDRGLTDYKVAEKHWKDFNMASHSKFSSHDYEPYRKVAFLAGEHISQESIVNIVRDLML